MSDKLVQSVDYQEDAVVSKEIIKKPGGTVTLFAFDKGQGLSEHTTPFEALAVIMEGTAAITVSGTRHELHKGEALLVPAGAPHEVKAAEAFKMMLVMVK